MVMDLIYPIYPFSNPEWVSLMFGTGDAIALNFPAYTGYWNFYLISTIAFLATFAIAVKSASLSFSPDWID